MPSPHPLELTEIVSVLVAYLPPSSLPACARVNKAWYQACIPYIWSNTDLDKLNKLPEFTALVQKRRLLIKKIRIGPMSQEYTALRFPNLDSLELDGECVGDNYTQFVMGHPTVSRLALRRFSPSYPSTFWDALLGFQNLRALSMSTREIFGANFDKVWQLCTRLERLGIHVTGHGPVTATLPAGELLFNIKHLEVDGSSCYSVPFFMEFLRRCPSLISIRWRSIYGHEDTFLSALSLMLEANTWPYLEHFDLGARQTRNELVAKTIQSMPQVTTLTLDMSYTVYNMDFAPLQPRFTNLRVLELLPEQRVKSRMAQDILSSCPLLEKLVAPHIDADVIMRGKPWVCLGLKILELAFCFDPSTTVGKHQPLVFDQLSKLTRLEEWHIVGPSGFAGTVDLRIENGLAKLSTLKRLRTITARDIVERMGDAEVDWMLEHWKHLEVFNGQLNKDRTVGNALRKRLREHGVMFR
ncbi:MAG: hypothetical protein J3Q66DRAFT_424904 [Benniella sp.]|nr:MAG: hypothetical protein J3Q66DRAFT_424904 [Benniella sp.]